MDREETGSVIEMAENLGKIYREFVDSVQALGTKARDSKRPSKMGESMMRWVGGSHASSDREGLCEKFLQEVQSQMELFELLLAETPKEEAAKAAALAVDVMMEPRPPKSDSTTDLMRRAMIGQSRPLLVYLTPEKLAEKTELLKKSYSRWHRLPVEQSMIKEMEGLLKSVR